MDTVRIVFLAFIGVLLFGALVLTWFSGVFHCQVGTPDGSIRDSRTRFDRPESAVGFLSTLAVSLFAHDPWVYAVALFVVASLLTDRGYLERVAAIVRGGNSGYWKYLEANTPAAIAEKQRREAWELKEAEQDDAPATVPASSSEHTRDQQPQVERSTQRAAAELLRVADFEDRAASALAHAFSGASAIRANMVLTSLDGRPQAEVDFIVNTARWKCPNNAGH